MDLIVLAVAFAIILLGAELFTNGIEWFGHKLQLAEGAVGSVLAAVGTALPETLIPIVAILFGSGAASDAIGIGAILGAPFMLSTLAMFIAGSTFLTLRRRRQGHDRMAVSAPVLRTDVGYFLVAYSLAVGVAILPADLVWPRWAVAAVLLSIYLYYVRQHLRAQVAVEAAESGPAPLRLGRLDRGRSPEASTPRLRVVNVQVLVALTLLVVGAWAFVDAVEHLSRSLGVDELILALVIAPIATELPEKFNSIIWIRQGKDTLALGNLTGAMVFQSTIPTVIALVFASGAWAVTTDSSLAFASALIALGSSVLIFGPMARLGRLHARGLLVGGIWYVLYLVIVLSSL